MPDLPELEQWVTFTPAHDCIRISCKFGSPGCHPGYPLSPGSHGIGSVEMYMRARGPLGAVQFHLLTGWFLDATPRDPVLKPLAAGVGWHSPKPLYEDMYHSDECDVLPDGCYFDSSGLAADEPWRLLREEGSDAVWTYLRGVYVDTFEKTPVAS